MDLRETEWVNCGLYPAGTGQIPVAGSCGHGCKIWVSIKGREFLDHLSDYWILKNGITP